MRLPNQESSGSETCAEHSASELFIATRLKYELLFGVESSELRLRWSTSGRGAGSTGSLAAPNV